MVKHLPKKGASTLLRSNPSSKSQNVKKKEICKHDIFKDVIKQGLKKMSKEERVDNLKQRKEFYKLLRDDEVNVGKPTHEITFFCDYFWALEHLKCDGYSEDAAKRKLDM